jgi:hypothetical protein
LPWWENAASPMSFSVTGKINPRLIAPAPSSVNWL